MEYITSKCPHCKYKYRNRESNVPKVQIGSTAFICPNCGNLIMDNIMTEYEFMTERERKTFESEKLLKSSLLGNVVMIMFGLFMAIGGFVIGDATSIIIGLIFGGACLYFSISNVINNVRLADNKVVEQYIFESLRRTSDKEYREFLISYYATLKRKKRYYNPLENRQQIMSEYIKFVPIENQKEFENEFKILKSKITTLDKVMSAKDVTTLN